MAAPAVECAERAPKRAAAGPLITVHAPHPEQLEVALDELGLDWSGRPDAKVLTPAHAAVAAPRTTIVTTGAAYAHMRVAGISDLQQLRWVMADLQTANPGAAVHIVVYEPALPKTDAHRRLLTHQVSVLIDERTELSAVLAGTQAGSARPVPGVPGGFVVETADPFAAIAVADEVRGRSGVKAAYPLVKRQMQPR